MDPHVLHLQLLSITVYASLIMILIFFYVFLSLLISSLITHFNFFIFSEKPHLSKADMLGQRTAYKLCIQFFVDRILEKWASREPQPNFVSMGILVKLQTAISPHPPDPTRAVFRVHG
ncbi:hypothetical protein L2E82_30347 [Cichorium intybus]|uniref:Uncharacterized protein n=1 Tax=Cichorium intybus TaxID=13427 RepID=A0ACB9D0F3_CICIN|nr:hypothetical protein L2E82_30347 [Cichorium intybus]